MPKKITKQMEENAAILDKFIAAKQNKDIDKKTYDKAYKEALSKFTYIVDMHVNKYKKFSNYNDLRQEGLIALCMAINNYNPNRSKNFFKLANWYIKTKIRRVANKHDVINLSLKKTKDQGHLNRVFEIPVLIDNHCSPQEELENHEATIIAINTINKLTENKQKVIKLYYGIEQKRKPISYICSILKLPKPSVIEILEEFRQMACEKM